jgi:NADPH:quinone reductase-like Zn-dependent oxidoreductase
MKAVVYDRSGSFSNLRISECEPPDLGPDGVLVRVKAAAANPLDWRFILVPPFMGKMLAKMAKAPLGRPGVDVAGIVEHVGDQVTLVKLGDEVFGGCRGGFAEIAWSRETKLAPKPESLTFEQAAGMNVAGVTALQGLRDHGKLRPGMDVLVNGAAGGVGTFVIQIAKALGATVTAVCSTRNVEFVKSLGADAVIDYTKEDFATGGKQFDIVYDTVGNRSMSAYRRCSKKTGTVILIGGPHTFGAILWFMLRSTAVRLLGAPRVISFIATVKREDLLVLKELVDAGKLTPVVDRVFPLEETADALRYLAEGHARGKVIVVP